MSHSRAAVWDTVALLTLFDAVNRTGEVSGNLKVQKLAFLAELGGREANLRVAHFRFFRYTNGPYSAQLAAHVTKLEECGVLTTRRALTKRGQYILDYAAEAIAESAQASEAADILRQVGVKNAKVSGTTMMHRIYAMHVPVIDWSNETERVRDIPHFTDILDPARESNLNDVMPFDEDTLEELRAELAMDASVLDRSTPTFRRTVGDAMRRISTACS